MGLQPKRAGFRDRIEPNPLPPVGFDTAAVHFAMMPAAEGDGELIADLPPESAALARA